MKTAIALLFLAIAAPLIGLSQSKSSPPFSTTIDWSSKTVDTARDELKGIRAQIAEEQRPQLEALSRIQSELTDLRREQNQLVFDTDGMRHNVDKLSDQVQGLASTHKNVQHRLLHLRRKFEEHLHPVEKPDYSESFLALEKVKPDTPNGRLEQLKALFTIADSAIDRIGSQIGGHRYSASVLNNSVMTQGTALQFGPYAFFSSQKGEAGIVTVGDDLMATLRLHTPETGIAITDSLSGSEASLPFDPLMDQAFLNADTKVTLWAHLKSGGIWIIPITIFGLASSIIALLKVLQIRAIRIPSKAQILTLVEASEKADFDQRLEAITPHARPIFAEGFAYRDAPESARSAAMSQVLIGFRNRVESRLSTLGLTAAVAPLLGLLGTVTGMIKTFQIISLHGAGDARALSGGISEALVTTEFGLIVAIPALLAHAWLNRRAKRISIETTALAERYNQTLPDNGNAR